MVKKRGRKGPVQRILVTLKKIRYDIGVTQEQVAAVAGVTRQSIANYERGHTNNPPLTLLVAWCRALNVRLAEVAEVSNV